VNTARLKQEKQILIRQCEADRQKLHECFAELEGKTSWAQLAIMGTSMMAPKLKLMLPVIKFLLPKLLSSGAAQEATGGVKQAITTAVEFAQKLLAVGKGLKVLPQLLPGRFK